MAPTADTMTIAGTLPSLTESLQSATCAVPSWENLQPPENGISLLDAKNEIFLAYLQSLALRNLKLIRDVREIVYGRQIHAPSDSTSQLQDQLVDNLIRQRVYLEKGVRPLEERLKYTIDKTLRAAADDDRKSENKQDAKSTGHRHGKTAISESTSGSDEEDESSDEDSSEDEAGVALAPNQKAMLQQGAKSVSRTSRPQENSDNRTGVYKPPRVTATSMPENFDRASRRKERPDRSRTMDEYVSAELADAPSAQPSIGSTIAQGGRRQISAREREKEQERRDYEETHLMRLPKQSNKDKAKKGGRDGGFGGEEWRGLGEGLDRIDSLTRGVKRRDKEGALEKSRKRRAAEDGQKQDGTQNGLFDRRKKRMMQKLR
ncbi:hypothetical protein K461DRAFT_317912, partial [Myriangium duriaei CBS 260.36]